MAWKWNTISIPTQGHHDVLADQLIYYGALLHQSHANPETEKSSVLNEVISPDWQLFSRIKFSAHRLQKDTIHFSTSEFAKKSYFDAP